MVIAMKAALFNGIKHMTFIEKELPKINKNEVLIKVKSVGICGSEVHAFMGTHPFRKPPSVLGHEMIGVVIDKGSNVNSIKIGECVTVEPQISCGRCTYCKDGFYNLCNQKIILGTDKWDGAFAEYIAAPKQTVYKIPNEISEVEGILIEPLAVGVHAVKIAGVKKDDKVAILGSGPIGLLTAVSAHHAGAKTICLTDVQDRKLSIGKILGATDVVNTTKQSLLKYTQKNIGKFDHVFLTVGHKQVANEALKIIKKRGKIITVALFNEKVAIDLNQVMLSEISVIGSSMYVKEDFKKAIEIIGSKNYQLKELVTDRFEFEEIKKAMDKACTKSGSPIKIVVDIGR